MYFNCGVSIVAALLLTGMISWYWRCPRCHHWKWVKKVKKVTSAKAGTYTFSKWICAHCSDPHRLSW